MGHHYKKSTSLNGFTIVELLIVIVVIAILTTIITVSYNLIQNQAKAGSAQSAAYQAGQKVSLWQNENLGQSPTLAQFTDLVGSANIGDYQYSPGTNGAYCITATRNNVSYYFSQAKTTAMVGACPGHGVDGVPAITNMIANPSLESDTAGWNLVVNGSSSSRTTAAGIFGTYGITSTAPANNLDSGVSMPTSGITFTAGTQYTVSVTIKAVTAGTYSLSPQGTAGSSSRNTRTLAAGASARFSYTWTPNVTGASVIYAMRQGNVAGGIAHTFYVDGAMLTVGSATPAYADGSSTGWAWTGTTNNSTSTGPPL